ncbi:2 beta-glucan [Russula earlei]|uniref:2 beta-glucan n=1 Tax=Russula earlei TaxID=71964 RepID=A0ACC0UGX6_9AGAM|nr:2 beta-glucan [Russula earlei]
MRLLAFAAFLVPLPNHALAGQYSLEDTYQGANFFSMFQFAAGSDPTHGRVNYVPEDVALGGSLALVSGSGDVIIRVDNTTFLSASGPGRNSVRIESNKLYDTHVSVFDIVHMPQGCGTWPAIWENGANWPAGGEIDILEGVNNQIQNLVTLHTTPGCSMPPSRDMIGSNTGLDCNAGVNFNAGCGVRLPGISYGTAFNVNGGGWYAIERTSTFVAVWFWGRNSASIPGEMTNGSNLINTDNWGIPAAYFPNTSCDIGLHFGPASININIALCGDWAGNSAVYAASGCPGTCIDFVDNNPAAFSDAFFEFSWIKVYS